MFLNVVKKISLEMFVPILSVSFVFLPFNEVKAANVGNTTGSVWAEKFGYVSMGGGVSTPDYGVTVSSTGLSGYAWSEKTGWINFDDSGAYYAVTNDGSGNLSGHAWSEKMGYISFDDQSANNYYQVIIDVHGIFSGYAWSEKAGYINMNDTNEGGGNNFYGATTSWAFVDVVTNEGTSLAGTSFVANGNITDVHSNTVSTRGFKYATSISGGTCDTWDWHEDGSFSTGTFNHSFDSLNRDSVYYYRAYATNARGTSYGNCVQVGTLRSASPVILRENVQLKKNVKIK